MLCAHTSNIKLLLISFIIFAFLGSAPRRPIIIVEHQGCMNQGFMKMYRSIYMKHVSTPFITKVKYIRSLHKKYLVINLADPLGKQNPNCFISIEVCGSIHNWVLSLQIRYISHVSTYYRISASIIFVKYTTYISKPTVQSLLCSKKMDMWELF